MNCSAPQPPASRRWFLVCFTAALSAACVSIGLAPFAPAGEPAHPSQTAASCPPVCQTFRVRPQDEIWVVNTRCLGCPNGAVEPNWTIWKYDAATPRWLNATAEEFYKHDDKAGVTAAYIHGSQIDTSWALRDGLDVYFQLAGCKDDEPPVRFVIWSWPSDKICGPLKDARAKACRSDTDAYYLARFLDGMQPQVKVGLIGYSLGARIIAGGLHLLGGGVLAGQMAPASDPPKVRVAFWAAAEHDDWLLPGRYHERALAHADRWFITRNCCDPVLSRYRWLEKCGDPVALGYSGLVGRNLLTAEQNARIEELDVTCLVGKSHDLPRYLFSLPIIEPTRQVVLWQD
jgi:hypothetical protein